MHTVASRAKRSELCDIYAGLVYATWMYCMSHTIERTYGTCLTRRMLTTVPMDSSEVLLALKFGSLEVFLARQLVAALKELRKGKKNYLHIFGVPTTQKLCS